MKAATLAEILATNDRQVDFVDCPEWGLRVYLRTMSGGARDKIDAMFAGHNNDPEKLEGMRAAVVAFSLCDENGSAYDVSPEDVQRLSEKSAAPLDRCYAKCVELSKLGGVEVELKN